MASFTYVTYIRTTPEQIWAALTEPAQMKQYWFGVQCFSEWRAGSPWKMVYPDGRVTDVGEIAESELLRRLVIRWRHQENAELAAEGESLCRMELEPRGPAVRLMLTHTIDREQSAFIQAISVAWPMALSNLKSLLETGSVVLDEPFVG